MFIYSSKRCLLGPRKHLQCRGALQAPGTQTQQDAPRGGVRGLRGLLTRVSHQLSYRAREIFTKFLCSKASTPVNIDSQAQLADDVLNAPHPDMFKEQQLQVTLPRVPQGEERRWWV